MCAAGWVAGLFAGAFALDAIPSVRVTMLAAVLVAVAGFAFVLLAAAMFAPKWRSISCGLAIGLVTSASAVGLLLAFASSGPRID
jgi:hypothetical protein